MTLLETFRSKAFWLIDALRGGDIRRNVKLLSEIEGDRPMADEEVEKYHQKAIYKLLRHCVESVPAYADLGYTLSHENPIKDWSVVNKLKLKGLSGGGISCRYDKSNLVAMTTSGSTGTPFTSWQNIGKKRHVN
ncbi:MAG: hypothetical protein NC453_29970, partial [Muribaculum sp.]|nr:hypothetical protein [Muribaculum sp.]